MEGEEETSVTVTVGEQSPTVDDATSVAATAAADAAAAEASAETAASAAQTAVIVAAGAAAAAEQQAAQTIGEAFTRIAAIEEQGNMLWSKMSGLETLLALMDGKLQTLMPLPEQPSSETIVEVIPEASVPEEVAAQAETQVVPEKVRRTRVI